MVLRLAERLDVPLRERNTLLLAAGYAPAFRERPLTDPDLAGAREAVNLVLTGHEPFPALAVDRHWRLVAANAAMTAMLAGIGPALLQPPVNVLRVGLHPDGMAPRIVNLGEWRAHVLARLRRQIDVSGDPVLQDLFDELRGYPFEPVAPDAAARSTARAAAPSHEVGGVVVPLQLASPAGVLSFISTTTVFGTPVDITLSELALETFFPADAATAAVLRAAADARG